MFLMRNLYRELAAVSALQLVFSIWAYEAGQDLFKISWAVYLGYLLLPASITLWPFKIRTKSSYMKAAEALPVESISWKQATEHLGGPTGEQYVVVGGAGFLGSRIVRALVLRGESKVRVVDLDQTGFEQLKRDLGDRVELVTADVTSPKQIEQALKGADCVFGPFAVIRYWEARKKHWNASLKVNVGGTKNLIEACEKHKVKRLIVTSSSAAVESFPGWVEEGIDESTPRCDSTNYVSNYCLSKSLQEQLVLSANGSNGLATGCARPCSTVFGYGDKLGLKIAFENKMQPVLDPDTPNDYVHVDCVVLGHLCLEHKLRNGPTDPAAGRAFCIANEMAIPKSTFAALLQRACEKRNIKMSIGHHLPSRLIYLLSILISGLDSIYPGNLIRLLGKDLGILTIPTMLHESHLLIVKPSKERDRILGYHPHMTVAAAVERTVQEYAENRVIM